MVNISNKKWCSLSIPILCAEGSFRPSVTFTYKKIPQKPALSLFNLSTHLIPFSNLMSSSLLDWKFHENRDRVCFVYCVPPSPRRFDIGVLTDPRETDHLRVSQFSDHELIHDLVAFIYTTTNQSLCPPTTSFVGHSKDSQHSRLIFSALITLGPGTSISQWLPQLFKLANPKPVYPAFSFFSNRNHSEGSCPPSPHPLCLLSLVYLCVTLCGPVWMSCLLFLGTLSSKLSFQWHLFPHLLASPYLKNNKTCILKPEYSTQQAGAARLIFAGD